MPIKKNIIFTLLAICAFLISSLGFATDCEELKKATIAQTEHTITLEDQLKNVVEFIQQKQAKDLPIKMVLGATNKECDRISDESYIFFDEMSHDPQGRPYLQASFNDLCQLEIIAKSMGSCLNQIVIDDSTFKFMEWEKEHISLFSKMLTKEGEFIFCPSVVIPVSTKNHTVSTDQEILKVLKDINSFSSNKLPTIYTIPTYIPLANDLQTPKVQEQFSKYQPLEQFNNLSFKECNARQKELRCPFFFSSAVLKDEKKLRNELVKIVKIPLITKIAEKELYLPHIEKMFQQHFNIIDFAENLPLPIPSNCNTTFPYIFYAKNPK